MTCMGDYVTAECGLCVRSEPSQDSEVLEILPFGTEVPGGAGDWIPARGGYVASEWLSEGCPYTYMGEWRVTAYAYSGSATASGKMPEAGVTIAHNTLLLGTKVYIEGVGVRTVEDRGPERMGSDWCDLYLGDWQECVDWGDQTRGVYLLK